MINTKPIELLMKLCLLSSYVADERPVSMLLLAPVEHGKTSILQKCANTPGVLYLNDMTAWGLQHHYLDEFQKGELKTLVVPDLITPLSKNADTSDALVSFLSGLLEEGVARVSTYATHLDYKIPITCNLIAAIAREFTGDRRYRWAKMGFLTRVIPVSFQYSGSTIDSIHDYIREGGYQTEPEWSVKLPEAPVEVFIPEIIAVQIQAKAQSLGTILQASQLAYGFRLHRQLHTIIKAHALSQGRDVVNEVDLLIVRHLCDFINFTYKTI